MSLRDVEEATRNEVSNAYLSQLEHGKIAQPSPRVLFSLARALRTDYEALMSRAGYLLPTSAATPQVAAGATYSIGNLTAEEESQLLEYLTFLRRKKK
jgi:transcriptional regulator with XRE-family HTH domain